MTMSNPVPSPGSTTSRQGPGTEARIAGGGFLSSQPAAESSDHLLPALASSSPGAYHRYHLEARPTPDIMPLPPRFQVKVKKHRLIAMVLKELLETRGDLPVALSRPCVYGVFSGPVGGL